MQIKATLNFQKYIFFRLVPNYKKNFLEYSCHKFIAEDCFSKKAKTSFRVAT